MKPVILHPGSVVAGLAFACALGFSSTQLRVKDGKTPLAPKQAEIRVAGIYDSQDAIRIVGQYTVPDNKALVLTAFASIQGGPAVIEIMDFWASGVPEQIHVDTLPSDPVIELPAPGIVLSAGKHLSTTIAYGYEVDVLDASPIQIVHIVGLSVDPSDFVYIRSNPQDPNSCYTVPLGRRLVVTGFGSSRDCIYAEVRDSRTPLHHAEIAAGQLFYAMPKPGLLISSGRVVNPVSDGTNDPFSARAIGYLIDE